MKIALLLKLLPVALLVLLAFDGASVGKAAYGADEDAGEVARAATQTYKASKDVQKAYDAAVAAIPHAGDTIDPATFVVDPKGGVRLTLHRKADTVVLWRLREGWTEVTVEGEAGSPS